MASGGSIAQFDNTSDSDATVDSAFVTSIGGLRLESGYDGTVTLGRNQSVSGAVVLSGGTLDVSASDYDLTVEGDWNQHPNATFTARSGTVYLQGTGTTLALSGSSAFSNVTLDNGLVGYWRLDDGSGSTVARDSSRFGNHGTLNGYTAVQLGTGWTIPTHTGKIGRAHV